MPALALLTAATLTSSYDILVLLTSATLTSSCRHDRPCRSRQLHPRRHLPIGNFTTLGANPFPSAPRNFNTSIGNTWLQYAPFFAS